MVASPLNRLGLTLALVLSFNLLPCLLAPFSLHAQPVKPDSNQASRASLQRENLVAWCIVPFDSQKRNPEQRAEMLAKLGIKRLAYDYRAEHIPTFDEEIRQLKAHGIELTAWWFPTQLNAEAKTILDVLSRHGLKTQLWVTGGGGPTSSEAERKERVTSEAKRLRPIAEAAQAIGCTVGLYNHGGWFGEPENQIAIIKELGMPNVGIVYNLHHAHDQIEQFPELLAKMKPHLLALNLNGMIPMGDKSGKKIAPIGSGELDAKILQNILDSGFRGPVGILNHTDHDAELRLLDNLEGLKWLLDSIDHPKSTLTPPKYRTWDSPPYVGTSFHAPAAPLSESIKRLAEASFEGEPSRGLSLFVSAKSACLSCHQIGKYGGSVGPDLSQIGKLRTRELLAESLLAPNQTVEPKYQVIQVLTTEGELLRGFRVREDDKELVLKDPAKGIETVLAKGDIEKSVPQATLMPDGLLGPLSEQDRADLVAFLADLGYSKKLQPAIMESVLMHAQPHDATSFAFTNQPLDPSSVPYHQAHVNRDRLYDFYAKQAIHFRNQKEPAKLLMQFPGLDGGKQGHWGNQNEDTWVNGDWNNTLLSSVQSGVFHYPNAKPIARGICIRLGDRDELSACFNPDTLTIDALWEGGFIEFSSVRHGFMHGLKPKGTMWPLPQQNQPRGELEYLGFYRLGKRVIFAYRIGDQEFLDAPWYEQGKYTRIIAPRESHPLASSLQSPPRQWPETIETNIRMGQEMPYAIDTIELPTKNPWNALLYCGDHDFLPDGSALVCTMQGDVWHVKGLTENEKPIGGKALWKRFASGLHQSLGLRVTPTGIFVLGRDQITRLHDLNKDGEADYYEAFSRAFETSTSGHDYLCGLQSDRDGNFYFASGNQGLVRISKDGKLATVIGEGFRNPDGLGIYPDGVVTVPCSEGEWTPSSMICAVKPVATQSSEIPFFGYRGQKFVKSPIIKPVPPMVYLPRGVDNSAGGQAYIDSQRWGPLSHRMVHFSFGAGRNFLLLRDEVNGSLQGAIVPLPGDFASGVHRGRFSPVDGQLYVSGMAGWGSYTPETGCFQRVRYTGADPKLPVSIHFHQNGVRLTFSNPIGASAVRPENHFAQAWNYRYSRAYGSSEYSPRIRSMRGHDRWEITRCHLSDDQRSLFLEIPELQPVNQLHLYIEIEKGIYRELFATCHQLDQPFDNWPGYRPIPKAMSPHPLELDVELASKRVPNPWEKKINGARPIQLEAGKNLSFNQKTLRVGADEPVKLTLSNPDAVPHNWALVLPGKLNQVGEESNKLVSDPEGMIRQYVPQTSDVLVYTDIVEPGEEASIYFRTPAKKGRYPFLCTFPGHWMVMNGELIVE